MQIRSKPREDSDDDDKAPLDPQEALYSLAYKWRVEKQMAVNDGSVTNSMQMLTAIPEVDLGMEWVIFTFSSSTHLRWFHFQMRSSLFIFEFFSSTRLKNIEDTEKAKRVKAEERHEKKKSSNDEEHLVATRCMSISCIICETS